MSKLRLLTIAPSHYCEKARWALDRVGAKFTEEAHPPLFHLFRTKPNGGRSVPILFSPHGTIKDSTDILHFLDGWVDGAKKLFPTEPKDRKEVEDLEDYFDRSLGPATRRIAYHYVLRDKDYFIALNMGGLGALELRAFKILAPVLMKAIKKGLHVDDEGKKRSEEKLEEVLLRVEKLLADGRSFLVGDRFTAADLTFASLFAPVLLPDEYGIPGGKPSMAFPAFDAYVASMRARPAGAFALRMFREHRSERVSNGA